RAITAAGALAAAFPASVEHGQGRVEALQHDLGRVLVLPVLFPLPGLQLALDINLGTLAQVILRHLGQTFAENHHTVPLGALARLARIAVAPAFRCRDAQIDDGATAR